MNLSDFMLLKEVPDRVQIPGLKLSYIQLWRWCTVGVRGIKLQHARIGRPYATTEAWLMDFITALGQAEKSSPEPKPMSTPVQAIIPKPLHKRSDEQEAAAVQLTQNRLKKMLQKGTK